MKVMGDENWFHGYIDSRDEAENILRDHGFAEGLFLVRPSTSALGDFVLSVVHDSSVLHYQIRKRGTDDAIFSLAANDTVIHGLDELVLYYKTHPNSGLQHSLTDFVPGDYCPVEERLHGTENLLHRATACGDLLVVSELLKSGYRNLAAKNHDGQTAIHLASFYGHTGVLSELIRNGSNVNVKDTSGYTPMHFAAQANKPEAIRVLLSEGKADPTIRNQHTDWVPLHEAAWKGHFECVEVLLDFFSPSRPRTPKFETPADLARTNGFYDLAAYLEAYVPPEPQWNEDSFLHSTMTRQEAIELLENQGNGAFLVRESVKRKNVWVLSLLHDLKFHHFEIIKQGIYFCMGNGPYMSSLPEMIDHHARFANGLPCKLAKPIRPLKILPAPRVKLRQRNMANPKNLRPIDPRKSYENNATLRRARLSRDFVPIDSIQAGPVIGEGEFGSVREAICTDEHGNVHNVAIKVLNTLEQSQAEEFLREAELMMRLDHQCVVRLLGITKDPSVIMIMELVPLGSLLTFLHENPDSVRTNVEISLWAAQVACGMGYLAENHFIHRDLAARNILLASKFQAKISDFGLSRHIGEKDYYKASKGGRWPIKWYAPECFNFATFTSASDVWSFGVLLWEMFTLGKQPYEEMTGLETVNFIEKGNRLPRPEKAEIEDYAIMQWCWEYVPENRPTFHELFQKFGENPEYGNLKELLKTQDLQHLGL